MYKGYVLFDSQENDAQEDAGSKLSHRVHHATDEEKLASTVMIQKDGTEEFSDYKTTTCTKTADGEGAFVSVVLLRSLLFSDNESIIIREWVNLSLMRSNKHCCVWLDSSGVLCRHTTLVNAKQTCLLCLLLFFQEEKSPLFCCPVNLHSTQLETILLFLFSFK